MPGQSGRLHRHACRCPHRWCAFWAPADLADGAKTSIDAFCPAGQQGVGGGSRGDDVNSEETKVTSSRPVTGTTVNAPPVDGGSFTGWRTTVVNESGGAAAAIRPEVWVVCADAPPAPAP